MFTKSQLAATAIVVAASTSSVVAGPLYPRGNGASQVVKAGAQLGKDYAHAKLTGYANDKVKSATSSQQPLSPEAQAAISSATGGHDPKLVSAAIAGATGKHPGAKKRDLLAVLEDILVARGNGASSAAGQAAKAGVQFGKDLAHAKLTGYANDKLKGATSSQQPLSPQAQAALNTASGGHDPKLVSAALAGATGKHKKRDLLVALDELYARGNGASTQAAKAGVQLAKDYAHAKVTGYANDKVKSATSSQQPLAPELQAAISSATGGHDPKLLSAAIAGATGKHPGTKKSDGSTHTGAQKRDLASLVDDYIAARDLVDELDELYARGNGASSAAKAGAQLGKDYAHAKLTGYINDKAKSATTPAPQPLSAPVQAALNTASGSHDPKLVSVALGGSMGKHPGAKKRDLDDIMEELMARELFYDELD